MTKSIRSPGKQLRIAHTEHMQRGSSTIEGKCSLTLHRMKMSRHGQVPNWRLF